MKKKFLIIINILIVCSFLIACGNTGSLGNNTTPTRPESMDYISDDEGSTPGQNGNDVSGTSDGEDKQRDEIPSRTEKPGTVAGDEIQSGDVDALSSRDRLIRQGFTYTEDKPFGEYRSIEELVAIIEGTATDTKMEMPEYQLSQETADTELQEYQGSEQTIGFAIDDLQEPAVEFADLATSISGEAAEDYFQDGNEAENRWTSSTLTAGLPMPEGGLSNTIIEGGRLEAVAAKATADVFTAYVESVKLAGFNMDEQVRDYSTMGLNMISYSAWHSDGRSITISLTESMLAIEIM